MNLLNFDHDKKALHTNGISIDVKYMKVYEIIHF